MFASSKDTVELQLTSMIRKYKHIKNLVSYNTSFNIPYTLLEDKAYKHINLMEMFANIIKEPYESYDGEKGYKWQKLEKFLDYYDVRLSGYKAVDYANALCKCYEKMQNN